MTDQTTRIKVGMSANVNLGDYNTIKFTYEIDDFVRDGEKTNTALDRVAGLVEMKLAEKVEEYKS